MQLIDGRFIYSATDLNNDLECRYLTTLHERVARGDLARPEKDETAKLIAEKGNEHEARFLEHMRGRYGTHLVEFPARAGRSLAEMASADAATLEEMARGSAIIYQATFFDGAFLGRTDFLRRVERPCVKWPWSYEVLDTKLAVSSKPYFILQLCNYSEQLERLQGTRPEYGYVVLGSGEEQRFRIDDFFAYYRHRKAAFFAERANPASRPYPNEVPHCTVCEWAPRCESRRIADDHLSLVAWMRRDQIDKLGDAGIATLTQLAQAGRDRRPREMSERTFATLSDQARLQHAQTIAIDAGVRDGRQYSSEFIDPDPKLKGAPYGFDLMPAPNEGDVFFDMEGDPLYAPGRGLEYLFGAYLPHERRYEPYWAKSLLEERAAFERFVDFIVARRKIYPDLHIYHYAPYETTALRRLTGIYGSREEEIDILLRGQVFVDLYSVVRQGLRISQPSYSIKKLEPFYGFERTTNLKRGDDSILRFEAWLVSHDDAILEDIERYNEDDCLSTYLLREWLIALRSDRIAHTGQPAQWRPVPPPPTDPAEADTRSPLERRLLDGLPDTPSLEELRSAPGDVRARRLLGGLLAFHRREAKPAWWKFFDRCENIGELTELDHEAIGELTWCDDVAPRKVSSRDQNFVYTYTFPPQQHHLGDGPPYCPSTQKVAGSIVSLDEDECRLEIKLAKAIEPDRLAALIPGRPIDTKDQQRSLQRIAQMYLDETLSARSQAAADLLPARAPRLRGRAAGDVLQPAEVTAEAISALVQSLDGSYLVVQGPPGTGKTTKGAAVIADLLQAGKRVGIMAAGHKAIQNLLAKIEAVMRDRGAVFRGLYKCNGMAGTQAADATIEIVNDYGTFADPHDLAAGTAWMFSREAFAGAYDYLFIDEAGQISLADALACAPSARNVVMLGDPLQLKGVSQGSHPVGTDLSVLQHVLSGAETIAPDRGIFLDVTYRLPPPLCDFISSMVYEGRLHAARGTFAHAVQSAHLNGTGLRYLPVSHAGNSRESREEAGRLVSECAALLSGSVTLGGPERRLTSADILVVAPYNAQRKLIRLKLAQAGLGDIRVGTVDKFQGQEAPVVFYSMATSSGDDLPRDMSFLFEQNRFNVAISRAQCLSVLVCSPELLDVRCNTIDQMRLVNLLCAFVERSGCPPLRREDAVNLQDEVFGRIGA